MQLFNRYHTNHDVLLVSGDLVVNLLTTTSVHASMSTSNDVTQWLVWGAHAIAIAAIVVVAFYYSDLYGIDQTLPTREMLLRICGGLGVAFIAIGLISYPIPNFGQGIYIVEILGLAVTLCLWRIVFARLVRYAPSRGKVLIVGLQNIGKLVAEALYQQKQLRMEVVGFVSDSSGQLTLTYGNPTKVTLPVLEPSALRQFVAQHRANRILLAGGGSVDHALAKDLVSLRTEGVPIEDCHSFYERVASKIVVADLSPQWIALSQGFCRHRLAMAAKRMIDLISAIIGLVLSLPISLLVSLAIKMESHGRVLYKQERVGENDTRFTLYKFRSMYEGAECGHAVWACENDPRVTRVGRFIRRMRVDEIPQMVNVLKGEMSFVGPRPERPTFVEKLEAKIPYYGLRHSIKPGITGWAQISYPYGDSEAAALEKLQYDLYYVKHMSPLFDLQILFETLKVVLFGKGAR